MGDRRHHWDEYYIGTFDGRNFIPDMTTPGATGVLDHGYVAAGKTGGNAANDPMGRRVFFGWNMPWSRQGSRGAEGPWRRRQLLAADGEGATTPSPGPMWPVMEAFGSQVLPRDLSLFPDGSLKMVPVPELASLRKGAGAADHYAVAGGRAKPTACLPVRGRQLEVSFSILVGASTADRGGAGLPAAASVSVLGSPDGRERTLIGANATHLIVNQMNSTLTPDLTPEELAKVTYFWDMAAVANHTILHAPLPPGKNHTVRAFLDGYNLEVFCDDRVAISTNLFPTLTESTCVGVETVGGGSVGGLEVWALGPAPITGIAP
jgi:sucrose-6-phosphate hydrolase SacC (GH32 family)